MELPALTPVIQAQFKGARVCGTRGGSSFLDVQRVESNGKCPKGTKACSMNASADNVVCYPPNDHKDKCPITSIDFVGGDAIRSYESKSDYKVLKLSFDQALVYSK